MAVCRQWTPLENIRNCLDKKIALIILNTPIEHGSERFGVLWKNAAITVCVDGAANHLYNSPYREQYVPNLITGDFDSAITEGLNFYQGKGTKIIPTPDQDQTDFTKCLEILVNEVKIKKLQVESIVACVSFGDGRFDHVMGNINTLFLASSWTDIPLYLISKESLTCLLPQGQHSIDVKLCPPETHCGLVPVGMACKCVKTTGLKWNLNNQEMQFGGLVSTSNLIDARDKVTVETDQPLLWTMSVLPE